MSHIARVDYEIKNLDWLEQACRTLGLELVRGQTEFYAYSTRECEHAIRVTGQQDRAESQRSYEIGLTARSDGRPGWILSYDAHLGGLGMQAIVGDRCGLLAQAYLQVATRATALKQGMRVTEQRLADGSIRLMLSKG